MNPTKEDALNFLRQNKLCVIATVNSEGRPEAATINYFVDAKMNFYFVTRKHTRKFANLLKNKNVAIVVGTVPGTSTLQCEGTGELLESESDIKEFMSALSDRPDILAIYSGTDPASTFAKVPGSDFAIFKVYFTWMRWMDYDLNKHEEIYRQII
jgi:general stress protein 26